MQHDVNRRVEVEVIDSATFAVKSELVKYLRLSVARPVAWIASHIPR